MEMPVLDGILVIEIIRVTNPTDAVTQKHGDQFIEGPLGTMVKRSMVIAIICQWDQSVIMIIMKISAKVVIVTTSLSHGMAFVEFLVDMIPTAMVDMSARTICLA